MLGVASDEIRPILLLKFERCVLVFNIYDIFCASSSFALLTSYKILAVSKIVSN